MESTNILKRIFLVFGIAFIIIIILFFLYNTNFNRLNENTSMLIHTLDVQDNAEELLGMIKDMESGTRGYTMTDDETYLLPFRIAKEKVPGKIRKLQALVSDNPQQIKYLDTLTLLIEHKIKNQDFIIHLNKSGNFRFGYKEILKESSMLMDSINIITSKMKNEEERKKVYRSLVGSDSVTSTKIVSTIFSATVVIIMMTSLFYILLEIRSKRKVKDLLDAVLEASQSAIISFQAIRQPDGRISDFLCLHSNKVGVTMSASKVTSLVGKTMTEIFPESIHTGLMEEYMKVVLENRVFKSERFYAGTDKGHWYRIIAVKLDDGIMVTFDDISKEKEYEVALQRYISELKRSNNELEQFAFVASHDLQEPLRKIQAFGDRLSTKAGHLLTEETKVYMEKMLSASTRMSGLISDLLNFSRLVRAKNDFVTTDLDRVLQDVLSDLEITIAKKQAVITHNQLPKIEAVSSQMYQLIFNLLGNALKFSKDNVPPRIDIRSELIKPTGFLRPGEQPPIQNNQRIRINVTDNGIGFDTKYVDKIFVIFQRLHGKHAYKGTGIGLAICKRIVINHDGNITATGVPGEGSVFTIELPVHQRS